MEGVPRGRGDLLGILAAAWIGGLGGLFVGAVDGGGMALIETGFSYYGGPTGYYASGTVYGFVGGAMVGSLVGLAAGAALRARFGNRGVALVGGVLGIAGAAVFGLFAYGLAVALEGAFMGDPALGGLLGAMVFAAPGGVMAVALLSGSTGIGRRAALRDLIAGGILGSFLGLLGGGFTELAIGAWVVPSNVGAFSMNVGLLFGFYLGAGVGAAVAVVLGAILRRRKARAPPPVPAAPSRTPPATPLAKAIRRRRLGLLVLPVAAVLVAAVAVLTYPPAVYVVPINASNMCGQGSSVCPAGQGSAMTCGNSQVSGLVTYSCMLPAPDYYTFRVEWSTSSPLMIGVGNDSAPCKWYDGGMRGLGCSTSVQPSSSGNATVNAQWNADGYISFWFIAPLGGPNVTVYLYRITAYRS